MHLEPPERTGLPPVAGTAVFDFLQRPQVFLIVRFHGYGPPDVLQRGNLITQSVVSQCTEIIPSCIPLGSIAQRVERFLIPTETDIIV